jgi:crotonyl-CoA carboxylase/reductase
MYLCETGGMVVICAGTTGYYASLDLRYHWMRQKRLQGSHFANDDEARATTELVAQGLVRPCLESTRPFVDIGECHQDMLEQRTPCGKVGVLVNAPVPNLRSLSEARRRAERWRSGVTLKSHYPEAVAHAETLDRIA